MLEFNPYYRPSARCLMKNSIFDKIRQKEQEKKSSVRVKLQYDKEKYYKDFENGEDNLPVKNMLVK